MYFLTKYKKVSFYVLLKNTFVDMPHPTLFIAVKVSVCEAEKYSVYFFKIFKYMFMIIKTQKSFSSRSKLKDVKKNSSVIIKTR